jgi:hypothetical protein
MFAARLPTLAFALAIALTACADQAWAVDTAPIHANEVLRIGAGTAPSQSLSSNRATPPAAPSEGDGNEDWTEPRRLLLGFAALFVFLAYRRRYTE